MIKTTQMGKVTYTGLKDSGYKANDRCFYSWYVKNKPDFDHEIEDGVCYSIACREIGKPENAGKDPIQVLYKAANKKMPRFPN